MLDHGHERFPLADEAGPVPGHAEVRVEPEADVATEAPVPCREVEVPGLPPQALVSRGVGQLVGRGEVEVAHEAPAG